MMGYWPLLRSGTEAEAKDTARLFNDQASGPFGERITGAQIAAMEAGSLFGWTVPAADPELYNDDGTLKPRKETENA